MTNHEKAVMFANSMRGKYIISQALYIAIETLQKISSPYTEKSNIVDMQFLMDEMFPIYPAVAQAEKTFGKVVGK